MTVDVAKGSSEGANKVLAGFGDVFRTLIEDFEKDDLPLCSLSYQHGYIIKLSSFRGPHR